MTLTPIGSPDSEPASVSQLAALEFAAVREFRKYSRNDRLRKAHGIVDSLRPITVIALEIIAMDKGELIRRVRKQYDTFGPFLAELSQATDAASSLLDIVKSAECRLAVALANVEGAGDQS